LSENLPWRKNEERTRCYTARGRRTERKVGENRKGKEGGGGVQISMLAKTITELWVMCKKINGHIEINVPAIQGEQVEALEALVTAENVPANSEWWRTWLGPSIRRLAEPNRRSVGAEHPPVVT
jgi:hypothetical protein